MSHTFKSPLASIRAKCLDCSAGQPREVRLCTRNQCALYPYRMGKDPNRAGRLLTAEEKRDLVQRLQTPNSKAPVELGHSKQIVPIAVKGN